MTVTLNDIRAAADRINGHVVRTPCHYSTALSRLTGADIFCKDEHRQVTGSFKERGARNRLMQLTPEESAKGVITASAGNHALGVAYHARQLKLPATVVMPTIAPLVKITNCSTLGAHVVLHGDNLEQARNHAFNLAAESGQTYIHGFDDPAVIAGAGTVGLEVFADVPDLDAIIVPVGGGGLIAGIALAMKALRPEVRIIGVESIRAPTVQASLERGAVTRIATRATLADGLAVSEVGAHCFSVIRDHVERIVMVDEGQIALAVLRLLELDKTVVEGAGAVGLAAMLTHELDLRGKRVGMILSGGNIDVTVLSRIIDRGMVMDGRLCRYHIQISDRPGSLARLLAVIATTGASIKEVTHDRSFGPADVAMTGVAVVLETRDRAHVDIIGQALKDAEITASLDAPPH